MDFEVLSHPSWYNYIQYCIFSLILFCEFPYRLVWKKECISPIHITINVPINRSNIEQFFQFIFKIIIKKENEIGKCFGVDANLVCITGSTNVKVQSQKKKKKKQE